MSNRFALNHLVLHYIGIRTLAPEDGQDPAKEKWQQQATKRQEVVALDEAIVHHLISLIEGTWDHPDASGVHSARFDPNPPDPGRRLVRGYLKKLGKTVFPKPADDLSAQQAFLELSTKIDDRLFECTTLAASPGLLMVADFSYAPRDSRHLALLKIRHTDERFVTILQDSWTDLRVQEVEMLLTEEILKGIIWPHPIRTDYDLKLIDHQAKYRAKPADYFALDFLGCQAKESDARQAARVSDALPRALAKKHGLELDEDQTDDFVVALVERTAPTAKVVANIATKTGLIADVEPSTLEAAVEEELEDDLPDILSSEQLEPDLAAIAANRGWTYDRNQYREFQAEMDHVLRLDEGKVTDSLIKTGLLKDADPKPLLESLEAMGGLDIPRETLIMRTKKKRRLLHYCFRVPRHPNSQEYVEVTVSGLPETITRFLSKGKGGNYVFSIEAAPSEFRMEYD